MICTQYKRHFLVCPRAISTQVVPGIVIGTEAMACRTVLAVGPSESLQVSGGVRAGTGGFQPQPEASTISRIATSRRRTRRA